MATLQRIAVTGRGHLKGHAHHPEHRGCGRISGCYFHRDICFQTKGSLLAILEVLAYLLSQLSVLGIVFGH